MWRRTVKFCGDYLIFSARNITLHRKWNCGQSRKPDWSFCANAAVCWRRLHRTFRTRRGHVIRQRHLTEHLRTSLLELCDLRTFSSIIVLKLVISDSARAKPFPLPFPSPFPFLFRRQCSDCYFVVPCNYLFTYLFSYLLTNFSFFPSFFFISSSFPFLPVFSFKFLFSTFSIRLSPPLNEY